MSAETALPVVPSVGTMVNNKNPVGSLQQSCARLMSKMWLPISANPVKDGVGAVAEVGVAAMNAAPDLMTQTAQSVQKLNPRHRPQRQAPMFLATL